MTYTAIDTNALTGEVTTRELTGEEISARKERLTPMAWNSLREERNRLLSNSDNYVLPDSWDTYTTEQQLSWATYRQALRDLPQNTIDPFDPVWPVKPE